LGFAVWDVLAAGFISGWTIKECVSGDKGLVDRAGGVIRVHDTIKTGVVEYRIIPGKVFNVDSIVEAVNRAWKDSLDGLYGRGLFEAKFVKEDIWVSVKLLLRVEYQWTRRRR